MPWNWQLPNWPHFQFDPEAIKLKEKQFLLGIGNSMAFVKTIQEAEYHSFVVEMMSTEGLKSAQIEGEVLNRESLQSSIRAHFGLKPNTRKPKKDKEERMAKLLTTVYQTYSAPLTHQMLFDWHEILFYGVSSIEDIGRYRTHPEPMQIVSHRYGDSIVFFEAPPSHQVHSEMTRFIRWYNSTDSVLVRAAIAHLYFENIHPFEDGNGRIGRLLVEKALSQSVGKAVLLAISRVLERGKKTYYRQLEKCNRSLDAQEWIEYFSDVILEAQKDSLNLLYFLVEKAKILTNHALNPRQEKALLRMFAEGPAGFQEGLSADNYITITDASRATATRDLADLIKRDILIKTGERRHTRYWLKFLHD